MTGGTTSTESHRFGADVIMIRPRVATWVCAGSAVVTVLILAGIAAVLRNSSTGVHFRVADQVAILVLGFLIAAGIMLFARPRVRADAAGIEVRNIGVVKYLPWSEVRAVSFPDGASWARLELPDDEYLPVMAIQAVDRAHAVESIRSVRALHAGAHTTPGR